jgi:D-alanine-D-alanine ligase
MVEKGAGRTRRGLGKRARRTQSAQGARRKRSSRVSHDAARKLRVGIIFGGKSGEHEISLLSAQSVMRAMNKDKYDIVPIGITSEGRWLMSGDPLKALTGGQATMPKLLDAGAKPLPRRATADVSRALTLGARRSGESPLDVIFPVLHGPMGEDGTVQGLFELADIPYVGAGVAASAVGMDKAAMKDVFRARGLPIVPHLIVLRSKWERDPSAVMKEIEDQIGFPCFVKPANLGSSVGVTKVHDYVELDAALAEAASYDRKLVVEWAVPHAREIECSVLGNDGPIASLPGEVKPGREFYDYHAKYFDEHTQLIVPAPLSEELTAQVRELAIRAFKAIDCAGMARVDFLLAGETDELYLSEINTIPGFTSVSMYPRMWEASGISYAELIDRLIDLALERHADKKRSRTTRLAGEGAE